MMRWALLAVLVVAVACGYSFVDRLWDYDWKRTAFVLALFAASAAASAAMAPLVVVAPPAVLGLILMGALCEEAL